MRLLPWIQEAHRRDPHPIGHLLDCDKCKRMNTSTERQYLGCGYEPALAGARPWQHSGYVGPVVDGKELGPTTCVGFTTKLPEVIETSRMRASWKVGSLRDACGGEPHEQVLDAVLLLDHETGQLEAWTMTPQSKGGGRAD